MHGELKNMDIKAYKDKYIWKNCICEDFDDKRLKITKVKCLLTFQN
jgi:hypothetical protein